LFERRGSVDQGDRPQIGQHLSEDDKAA